ncbi:hypothetical protein [Alkalicoccus urumqiensis]|uniref:Uncharacterized protein n=1 Tax=Alkalicoccus urumqiensis TaxID=1548213 RepID=A0A2P6MHP7_ALKUR|nr:hypothetical protein [Alkalicoccus urumqiensis]PRO65807.1 hypothetical protein C6I21_07875 [Alkalicoccus urumqiensis]
MNWEEAQETLKTYYFREAEEVTIWEVVELMQEEVDEQEFPPHLLDVLEDPLLLGCVFIRTRTGRIWQLRLVLHPQGEGFFGWGFASSTEEWLPAVHILPNRSVVEIEEWG